MPIIMATANNEKFEIEPDDPAGLTLQEAKELLECQTVEIIRGVDGYILLVDEDAKLLGKPKGFLPNGYFQAKTKRFHGGIAGDVIICKEGDMKWT